MNLSKKYGLEYRLFDNSVGTPYRYDTHLTVDCTMKNFQYMDENSLRGYFEYDKCPKKLNKKLSCLDI
uniref:Polo kinase n=1 Tax=Strongyloides venezuelensis TaxID=75913 RepID=A0A0K0FV76_STRVS